MRTYDFTPLWRSTIGFDRFFDLVDAAQHGTADDNYPPCNVERLGEDRYQISLALAGFTPDEIAITAEKMRSLGIPIRTWATQSVTICASVSLRRALPGRLGSRSSAVQ